MYKEFQDNPIEREIAFSLMDDASREFFDALNSDEKAGSMLICPFSMGGTPPKLCPGRAYCAFCPLDWVGNACGEDEEWNLHVTPDDAMPAYRRSEIPDDVERAVIELIDIRGDVKALRDAVVELVQILNEIQ